MTQLSRTVFQELSKCHQYRWRINVKANQDSLHILVVGDFNGKIGNKINGNGNWKENAYRTNKNITNQHLMNAGGKCNGTWTMEQGKEKSV